jgi:hypothetical protein
MRPVLVIIADEVIHEGLQMAFVEHDHMIKQFATATAYPTAPGPNRMVT